MLESLESLSPLVAILLLFVATVGLFLKFQSKQHERSIKFQTEQQARSEKTADGFQETMKETAAAFQAASEAGHKFGFHAAEVIAHNTDAMTKFNDTATEINFRLGELKKTE